MPLFPMDPEAMTSMTKSGPADGNLGRRPITDVKAWLDELELNIGPTLHALGELLTGVAERRERPETADSFTARSLAVDDRQQLYQEERSLNTVTRLTTAVALAQWINDYEGVCKLGPGDHTAPPQWTQTEVGDEIYRHPLCLSAAFPAGTLIEDATCVIHIDARQSAVRHPQVSIFVTSDRRNRARSVLDTLSRDANNRNPYRGRAVRASYNLADGLRMSVIALPSATRENIIVPDDIWAELDLGVTAVRDRHRMLNAHGLGARRGVLLCGPPGAGKSAISAVLARELIGDFTVIYVEAKAGAQLLTAVVEEAQRLGGPVLLILEDVDLWCRSRTAGGSGLSELLQAMDIQSDARILTVASTNDAATLDKAAIRTGRFDSVVEIRLPKRSEAERILDALIRAMPGSEDTDIGAVVAALPDHTSGSDIREIVRRAVLAGDGKISTAQLLIEVDNGRYRALVPDGMYL